MLNFARLASLAVHVAKQVSLATELSSVQVD